MRMLLIRWIVLAAAIGVAAKVVHGVHVTGGITGVLIVAALFGLVNAVLGPIAKLLAFPAIVLTLGLFIFVINAAMLGVTAWLTSRLTIGSFGAAVVAAFWISLVSAACNLFVGRQSKSYHRAKSSRP